VTWSAASRARLALVVLLAELLVALAGPPSGARQVAHRTTVDVVVARTCAARLPQGPEAKSAVEPRAGDGAPYAVLSLVPIVARASWQRADFVEVSESWAAARTCAERARGPPASA
jgi:hypothetical protein